MRRFSTLLFSLLLIFTFTACDSDGDDGDGNGNGNGNTVGDSEVMVSGAVTDSFSGGAIFGADDDGSDFGLALFEGNLATGGLPSGAFVAFAREEGLPPEGTYALGEEDGDMVISGGYASDFSGIIGATIVASESGTITITSSSSDRIAGSFSFTGPAENSSGELGEATVSGTFDADLASTLPTTPFP
jgi:hypothetical protein